MKKLIGLVVSVALMGSGVALANEGKDKHQQTQSQGATGGAGNVGSEQPDSTMGQDIGGSGQQGQQGQQGQAGMDQQLSGNQLTGRVVKSDRRTIWVEHAGAIVPLKVNKDTQFTDPNLKRARDLKEGEEIRASFEVQETDNVAKTIERTDAGMGGSGQDMMQPDESLNQPPEPILPPVNEGTGGGGEMDTDIDEAPGADTGEVLDPAPDGARGDY